MYGKGIGLTSQTSTGLRNLILETPESNGSRTLQQLTSRIQ